MNVTLTHDEIMQTLAKYTGELLSKSNVTTNQVDENYVSPFAVYLMSKADRAVARRNGTLLSKSEVDEATFDFTMGRTLTEEDAEATVRFIFDKSPWLNLFNSRTVKELVTPIQGRAITKKNLVSNEQKGSAVTNVNRRIVHNFGVNLQLKNIHLQKNIPLQTVVNNLYNPNFESETMNDVAIALANDILLLATNGLEYTAYSSSENFYDLNKGFVRILQLADGANTNTYGSVAIRGFMGKHLTPQKVNAATLVGSYTAANLLALMSTMYKAMLPEYRNDSGNVWMMSQVDADAYADSRSDMASPSNTTREANLTGGLVPNYKGHRIVVIPDMYGIAETHEYQATVPGAIIFGNPKNIDVAMSSNNIIRSSSYDARGADGAVFKYDFHGYIDTHVSKPESFVIAFNGAKVSTPYLVSAAGNANGQSGKLEEAEANVYGTGGDVTGAVYCDNAGAIIVMATESLATKDLTDALAATGATVLQQGVVTTFDTADKYIKAYHPNMAASTQITLNCAS